MATGFEDFALRYIMIGSVNLPEVGEGRELFLPGGPVVCPGRKERA